MPIQIDLLPLGLLQTNCYIVGDTETLDAIIIDPAAQPEIIIEKVKERGYTVREIIATHAHFDHVIASKPVKDAFQVPFRLHQNEFEQLRAMPARAGWFGIEVTEPAAEPDGTIDHGDVIEVASIRLEARFTPGHSPGHLTFVMAEQEIAFVGDCVFRDGIGRTDLPGADTATLKKSVIEQILTLPDSFTLCSGHGPITKLGREKYESLALRQLLDFRG